VELEHYFRRVALLDARVRSVAKGFQVGAYIVGRPGSGKTHSVRRVLDECEADYVFINGRLSPAALFDAIAERPDSVLVIDDIPTLFDSPAAAQILMAAAGGDPGTPRRVTYLTRVVRQEVDFRGGLIALSNRPLRHDSAGQALASRLAMLQHEPTDEELIAFMEDKARRGVKDVTPRECMAVFGHVVRVCRSGDYRIDLRYFFKGIQDYLCYKSGECEMDWRVLVESSMQRVAADDLPPTPLNRADTKAEEQDIVRQLHARRLAREVLAGEWNRRTGKAMDSYYRRRRELGLK
jgi:hypothetical protein